MKLGLFLLFSVCSMFLFFLMAYSHEVIHQNIFNDYGIKSKINLLADFPDFTTTPESPCENPNCILQHNFNDMIGYPLIFMTIIIIIGLMIIIGILEDRLYIQEEEITCGHRGE